jgi:uncharacterized protein
MARDWIFGGCAMTGRDRASLIAFWKGLLQHGGGPFGQAKLARDAGLANNSIGPAYLSSSAS